MFGVIYLPLILSNCNECDEMNRMIIGMFFLMGLLLIGCTNNGLSNVTFEVVEQTLGLESNNIVSMVTYNSNTNKVWGVLTYQRPSTQKLDNVQYVIENDILVIHITTKGYDSDEFVSDEFVVNEKVIFIIDNIILNNVNYDRDGKVKFIINSKEMGSIGIIKEHVVLTEPLGN